MMSRNPQGLMRHRFLPLPAPRLEPPATPRRADGCGRLSGVVTSVSRALHGARSTDAPQAIAVHDHRLRDRPTSDGGGRGGRRALALSPPAPLLERDLDRLRPALAGEPGGIRLRHVRHPRAAAYVHQQRGSSSSRIVVCAATVAHGDRWNTRLRKVGVHRVAAVHSGESWFAKRRNRGYSHRG